MADLRMNLRDIWEGRLREPGGPNVRQGFSLELDSNEHSNNRYLLRSTPSRGVPSLPQRNTAVRNGIQFSRPDRLEPHGHQRHRGRSVGPNDPPTLRSRSLLGVPVHIDVPASLQSSYRGSVEGFLRNSVHGGRKRNIAPRCRAQGQIDTFPPTQSRRQIQPRASLSPTVDPPTCREVVSTTPEDLLKIREPRLLRETTLENR